MKQNEKTHVMTDVTDKVSNMHNCPPALHNIHVVMDIYNSCKAHGGMTVNRMTQHQITSLKGEGKTIIKWLGVISVCV